MKALVSIGLMTFSLFCFGQRRITFLDQKTGEPIEGVALKIVSLGANLRNEFEVTDDHGVIQTPLRGPIVVEASHLSYETLIDTVSVKTITYKLVPRQIELKDVVITGQYRPQSAKRSVYSVRVIDQKAIQSQGAVKLSEVLSKELNIRISPDLSTGESGLSMQGISGKNVKVLIDGVPLVGRNGNGSSADLSQINLNNIERIEIVEGPMAVNYGANALAGVINLITKKNINGHLSANVNLQTESVDNHFLPNKSRSAATAGFGYNLTKQIAINTHMGTTKFGGYQGLKKGRDLDWNPKRQWFGDAALRYRGNRYNVYYKFDYLNESIDDPGSIIPYVQPSTGVDKSFAWDQNFTSKRYVHQIQADGQLYEGNRYNLVFSYSDYTRDKTRFKNELYTGIQTPDATIGANDRSLFDAWVFRGTYSGVNVFSNVDFEIGYDINLEKAGGGRIKDGLGRSIQDYAIFSSTEIKLSPSLKFRPGLRWSYNSIFDSPLTPSVNIKFSPQNSHIEFRAAYGRGYRAPGLRELYLEFVDASHHVFGNEHLQPEYSNHFDINLIHRLHKQKWALNSTISAFYNNIDNLINFAFSSTDASYAMYVNIGKFESLGFSLKEDFLRGPLSGTAGVSYIGTFEDFENEGLPREFLFSPEIQGSLTYSEPHTGASLNLFYKYNGIKLRNAFSTNSAGDQVLTREHTDGYSILDLTLARSFGQHLNLSFGAKNILNITDVNNTGGSGGVHSGGPNTPVGYGRSYFINMNFKLNK